MKKVVFILLAVVLAVGIFLAGCGEPEPTATPTATPTVKPTETPTAKPTAEPTAKPTAEPTTPTKPAPYGTITAASADFANQTFDPNKMASIWGWYIYDPVVTYAEDNSVIGCAVESFHMDEAGTWHMKVREGMTFSNGDPVTAEDIKFSLDRFGDLSKSQSPWSPYISEIYNKKEIVVDDTYNLRFIADHPEIAQKYCFAATLVLNKKYIESVGEEAAFANPIGSGAWKVSEFIANTSITFEAREEYWGEVPAYQYLTELQVPEQSTRIAMLKAGDVDIAYAIDYDRLAELKNLGFRMESIGLPSHTCLSTQASFLPSSGPVHDIRIRKALSYAINREEICATWFQGFGKPGGQFFMHRGCFGWTDDLIPEDYNPTLAKELMAQAGYPDRWENPTITIYCPATAQDFMLIILGYWDEAGFETRLEVVDTTVYWGMLFTRPQEGDQNVGWFWPWTSSSVQNCTYHCANMYTTWGVHGTSNDAKATEMYDAYIAITDVAEAEKAWAEFQKYVKTLYVNLGISEVEPLMPVSNALGEFAGRNWLAWQMAVSGIQHPAE